MDKEALKKSVCVNLRCVTQSCKGGVPLNRLDSDYKALVGSPIPVGDLGYNSLSNFLQSIPDVIRLIKNSNGQLLVEAVADASTAHISKLISRQKGSKTSKVTSKKSSLSIKKYSCHESWRSQPTSAGGMHRQDKKTSDSNPVKHKAPVSKISNAGSIIPPPKIAVSQQQNNNQNTTAPPLYSVVASTNFNNVPNEISVLKTNIITKSNLSKQQRIRRRRKIRVATEKLIETSKVPLTKSQLLKKALKAQELCMTVEEFLRTLKASTSTSQKDLDSCKSIKKVPTLNVNHDSSKSIEKVCPKELKSVTLRNLWNVTFSFKNGVPLNILEKEYENMIRTPIPYKELGHTSLLSFIQGIPDVIRLKKDKEENVYAEAVSGTDTLNLSSQMKAIPSTSKESFASVDFASENSWETSSNSSSNTPKIASKDLKSSGDCSLETIQSAKSSSATKSAVPPSLVVNTKHELPAFSQPLFQATPQKSANDLNLQGKPTLNSFPGIKQSIASANFNSLLLLNFFLFGNDSYMETLKRGILAFDGFSFCEGSEQWKQKELLLSMLSEETLKECLKLLSIKYKPKSNKEVLLHKLMQFLVAPSKALLHTFKEEKTEEINRKENKTGNTSNPTSNNVLDNLLQLKGHTNNIEARNAFLQIPVQPAKHLAQPEMCKMCYPVNSLQSGIVSVKVNNRRRMKKQSQTLPSINSDNVKVESE